MKFLKFINLVRNRFVGRKAGDNTYYINFQKFQAKEILKEIKNRGIDLSSMNVLELGAGEGGYSLIFKENAKSFTVSDIDKPKIFENDSSLNYKKVDVTKKFPFKDNTFDFIFSCSLIEHIKDPRVMLKEARRVLDKNGYLYLSFPPFYSPVGGHQLKPFHLLGEKISIKIVNFLKKENIKSYDTLWGSFGLYKRNIKDVKKLLLSEKFDIIDMWTRFSPVNTSKIPFLNEFLTWHACFLCKKLN